jgi:hypothetical protein
MDDIAWLSLRAVQEPFTHLPDRLAEYEQLSGHVIHEERVRYYRVMAEAKLLVMSHRPDGRGLRSAAEGGGDIGNGLIYGMLHRRLWLEALADFIGLELTAPEVPATRERDEHEWLYDTLLSELRNIIVPRISDPLALQRSKGLARIIKYLAQIDAHGPFYEECELDDLAKLLGQRPPSVTSGRAAVAAAVRDAKLSDQQYLAYQWRRIARDNELLRPASGVMADRHWPPLH